jgi:hypothetical protein
MSLLLQRRVFAQKIVSAAFHFGRFEVLLPREEHPDVTEGIAHARGVRAVKHVGGRLNRFGACLHCSPQELHVVIHKEMEARRAAAKRERVAVILPSGIADHHD